MSTIISFRDVTYRYPDAYETVNTNAPAPLKTINLDIEQGSFVLLCGASGSGKTTLTRLINGLIPHYWEAGKLEGNIVVDGKNVATSTLYDMSSSVASVFQNPRSQFFTVDTTSEIAFGLENHGIPRDEISHKVDKAVEVCRVEELLGRSIFHLSGGQKQKIACASAVAMGTPIYVFDEPSANLDFVSIADIQAVMERLKKSEATVIVAEHRLHYLAQLVDRVIYMADGEIACEWTGDEFRHVPHDEIRARGLRPINLSRDAVRKKEHSRQTKAQQWHIENLSFTYSTSAHAGIHIDSLALNSGRITAVIGANGAGKTTFLRCMAGIEKRARGTLRSPNGTVYKGRKRAKQSYMVFQDVNHQLFTEELIDEITLSMPSDNEEQARELLARMNLGGHIGSHPLGLSGGQKQRLAIASAIASQRPLLLFDEPTSGLDYTHMEMVADELRQLAHKGGKTVVLVSHDVELLAACADDIVVLEDGRVVQTWNMDEENGLDALLAFFTSMFQRTHAKQDHANHAEDEHRDMEACDGNTEN